MPLSIRPYAGPADVRPMQRLIQRHWNILSHHHIGAFLWERVEQYAPTDETPTMLWWDNDDLVAWGWIYTRDPAVLYLEHDRARPDLIDAVLDWFEAAAVANELRVPLFAERTDLTAALSARSFVQEGDDAPHGWRHRHDLTDIPPVRLPRGYRAFSTAEHFDLERRIRAHRTAWDRISGREGDLLSPEDIARRFAESVTLRAPLFDAWPYRRALDWVTEAPDGRWVANCILWLDDVHGVGTFEPVGTDADERRRGYGAAACLSALHALRRLGGKYALVDAAAHPGYPVPSKFYQSLGFKQIIRQRTFIRRRLI